MPGRSASPVPPRLAPGDRRRRTEIRGAAVAPSVGSLGAASHTGKIRGRPGEMEGVVCRA